MNNRDYAKYGLKFTVVQGKTEVRCLCPECESTRTHKGHKDCSVNLESGKWHCHHCGASGYVPTQEEEEKRTAKERRIDRLRNMAPAKKQFARPQYHSEFLVAHVALDPNTEQRSIIDYLTQTRKLSIEVLTRSRVTINYVKQWRDDPSGAKDKDGKPIRQEYLAPVMAFNYFDRNILVNQKCRKLDKTFWMHKGAEVIPYNINSILRKEVCYITEGEFDALSLIEAGMPEAISVPAGGSNTNLTWLDRFMETHFMDKRVIYEVNPRSWTQLLGLHEKKNRRRKARSNPSSRGWSITSFSVRSLAYWTPPTL